MLRVRRQHDVQARSNSPPMSSRSKLQIRLRSSVLSLLSAQLTRLSLLHVMQAAGLRRRAAGALEVQCKPCCAIWAAWAQDWTTQKSTLSASKVRALSPFGILCQRLQGVSISLLQRELTIWVSGYQTAHSPVARGICVLSRHRER